ncbi:large ribosomal subunit protein P2-like isoform X3 [Chrysemys picta bellii]|uniref:large ribosomal subunit protein P2-like isoform X3 n=1 Tax=Chrysemys picta bellii TaxID=8478 RepID=UPI0032B1BEDB
MFPSSTSIPWDTIVLLCNGKCLSTWDMQVTYGSRIPPPFCSKVIGELNGNNIEDVIAQGNGKLASMPVGGAVAVSAGPGSAAPAAAEEKEESDNDMECGLFD